MKKINQIDVLQSLNNLMGRRVLPGGEQDDLKRYCQESFDYCWRYYKWSFSLKTATLVEQSGEVWLPEDFDLDGYRKPVGATEVELDEILTSTGGSIFAIEYDNDENRYKTRPATPMQLVYQTAPPILGTDEAGSAPFPSASVVAIGATVLAKQAENPTRADVQQEWDQWHAELDRLVGRADTNKPRRRVRNYHDKMGTFTGDV
jgi:hypothetical protein